MSCYHPLKAFPIGLTENNKTQYKITSYKTDHVELIKGIWTPVTEHYRSDLAQRAVWHSIEIPCGKCVGCRLEYSRQWANRCMLELEYSDSAYFVTLTYDDAHLPLVSKDDSSPVATVCKRDFQLFMKRLRKKCGDGIRFFAAAEYGEHTFRPHYHAIIFNLKLDDLVLYKRSPLGYNYYNSQILQDAWSVRDDKGILTPLGYAVAGAVTWETAAYTARYVMKKLQGPEAKFYSDLGIEAPFSLMSRRPGIARQWYDDHPGCAAEFYLTVSTEKGGKKFRPPRYFDRLFDLEDPETSKEIKEQRMKLAKAAKKAKLAQCTYDYEQMLEVAENAKINRLKALRRDL